MTNQPNQPNQPEQGSIIGAKDSQTKEQRTVELQELMDQNGAMMQQIREGGAQVNIELARLECLIDFLFANDSDRHLAYELKFHREFNAGMKDVLEQERKRKAHEKLLKASGGLAVPNGLRPNREQRRRRR